MLNDLNSSTNIPVPNKKIDERIDSIQDQVNELENRISAEETKTSETLTSVTTNGLNVEVSANIKSLVADNATINDVQSSTITSSKVDTQNITSTSGTINSLNSTTIQTRNLTVTSNLQLNTVQANSAKASSLEVTNTVKSNKVETNAVESSNITSTNVNATKVTSDETNSKSITSDSITTKNLEVTNDVNLKNITSDSITTKEANIDEITSDSADITNIKNEYIRGKGQINVDPNFQVDSDWFTIYIPRYYTNHQVMLHGHYKQPDGTKQEWSITEVGTTYTSMLTWSQTSLETIRELSFDKETGRVAIKVKAEDFVDYLVSYIDENGEELTAVLNGPGYETIYVPETLQGYTFQSYNDDTTDFYFGGRVSLHSLKAEVQEFDWATYKNIGVQFDLKVPKAYDPVTGKPIDGEDGWSGSDYHQYLTTRDVYYPEIDLTIKQLVWEDLSQSVNEEDDRPIRSDAISSYDGTTDQGNYPITHLGDGTTTHGNQVVDGQLEVSSFIHNPKIYVGEDADYQNVEDNGIIVNENGTFRKTTKDDEEKRDEIAVYESTATLEDKKPLVYNEENKSIQTSDSLDIDSLNVNNLNVANDAVVGGDLYVKGTTHTVDEETISSTSDNIVLRQNNDSPLANNQLSGIIINNYDGNGKVAIIGSDNKGTIRVGDSETTDTTFDVIYLKDGTWYNEDKEEVEVTGELVAYTSKSIDEDNYTKYEDAIFAEFDNSNTVPLLAREEAEDLNDKALLKWNADKNIAEDIALPTKSEQTLESSYSTSRTSTVQTIKDAVQDRELFTPQLTIPLSYIPTQSGMEIIMNGAGMIIEKVELNNNEYIVNESQVLQPTDSVTIRYDKTELVYTWADKKAGSFVFNTVAEYEASSDNIPENSLITILEEDNYVFGDDR